MNHYQSEWLDLRRMDNMELMVQFPDKHFDLAIVDPPYGIGEKFKGGKNGRLQFNEVVSKGWDKVPSEAYFGELSRISRNQIIWGGNYFHLGPSRCWIVWDKMNAEDFSLAMCELAWTSFDAVAKIYKRNSLQGDKIHPTQKPVALYRWLLANYAKPDQKILDTHLGSGSIAIACHYARLHLTACELDEDYFVASIARIKRETAQETFDFTQQPAMTTDPDKTQPQDDDDLDDVPLGPACDMTDPDCESCQ